MLAGTKLRQDGFKHLGLLLLDGLVDGLVLLDLLDRFGELSLSSTSLARAR
jgi:hypothetical protein